MKKFLTVSAVFCAALTLASAAVAADEMAGMKMDNGAMSAAKPGKSQLTDAVVEAEKSVRKYGTRATPWN